MAAFSFATYARKLLVRLDTPLLRFVVREGSWILIEDCLVVELTSVDKLLPIHSAQLMTYLRLLRVSSGLLMNFNVDALHHGLRRILR